MKIIVVGATHAGTFATQQILTEHPDYQVTVYERNNNLSFLSCGIALWVGNHVSDPKKMFYSSPEALAGLGADMKMGHDVLSIDIAAKQVVVKDLATGQTSTESYDKLVVTTGSLPVIPPLPGIDAPKVYRAKNYADAEALKAVAEQIDSAVVIGAGYIGAELAEQLDSLGKQVTLIDALPRVLANNFGAEVTERVEAEYRSHGVKLALGQTVTGFTGGQAAGQPVTVTTDKGSYTADIAILALGFVPNTELVRDQLETLPGGAIITDEYMRAVTHPDVFAAGDSAAVKYNPTGKDDYIPLATNAVRQGILVGKNIDQPRHKYLGTQSSSAVQLFDYSLASTGLTPETAAHKGVEADYVTIEQDYRPAFMLSTTPVLCQLVYSPTTHKVLGAAFLAKHDISQAANAVSIAIQAGMSVEDLAMVDTLFQPNFDQPLNYINAVAMAAAAKLGW